MKLYYSPGTCSLSPHIVAREAAIAVDLVRVDILSNPHVTEEGVEYAAVTPKGYVPALELDDGQVLTEGPAIVQYLADRAPTSGLVPPHGTFERHRLAEWLNFVSSELHKMFSPWLFHPEHGKQAAGVAKAKIRNRLAFIEKHLSDRPYLLGDRFTVGDAYLFTVARWSQMVGIDLAQWPQLAVYVHRIAARPMVQAAMRAEGLLQQAA